MQAGQGRWRRRTGGDAFNYGDIPIWDRLFGTYRDTTVFAPRCGFPESAEQRLGAMLRFVDVYDRA